MINLILRYYIYASYTLLNEIISRLDYRDLPNIYHVRSKLQL